MFFFPDSERAMEITFLLLSSAIASPAWAQAGASPDTAIADDIMGRARREIAAVPGEPDGEPAGQRKLLHSGLQARLDRRFAEARAAARPRWYQPARIEETTIAADNTTRNYRITTGVGSYCMTYPKDGRRPTYGLCSGSGS